MRTYFLQCDGIFELFYSSTIASSMNKPTTSALTSRLGLSRRPHLGRAFPNTKNSLGISNMCSFMKHYQCVCARCHDPFKMPQPLANVAREQKITIIYFPYLRRDPSLPHPCIFEQICCMIHHGDGCEHPGKVHHAREARRRLEARQGRSSYEVWG